jgi:hypothetical protein
MTLLAHYSRRTATIPLHLGTTADTLPWQKDTRSGIGRTHGWLTDGRVPENIDR